MRRNKTAFLVFFIFLVFFGCKTTRKVLDDTVVIPLDEHELVKRIGHAKADVDNVFFHHASVQFKTTTQNQTFRTNIYIKVDSFIRASILAPMGIEVARISFEPGRVVIIDRLDRDVIYTGYHEVNKRFGVEVDYHFLENLFLNRAFSYFENEAVFLSDYHSGIDNKQYILASLKDRQYKRLINGDLNDNIVFHRLWINPKAFYLNKTSFFQHRNELSLDIVYNDFVKEYSDFYFPKGFSLTGTRSGDEFSVDFGYGNVIFNEGKDLSFSIPEKYEKIYR